MTIARRGVPSLALALAFLALMSPAPARPDLTAAALRKPAPAFALPDPKGATVSLAAYKGKVVLLNFWATWCHGCQEEIPWFVEFETAYGAKGLQVVGASMDADGWKSVKPYLRKKKLNYPIVIGSKGLADSYGLETMPWTILIDKEGRIAATYSGVVNRAGCEKEIQALLAAPSSH